MVSSRLPVLLCPVLAFLILASPACADLIAPAITHVYFIKDGVPYHGSVQYSVKCYGYPLSDPPVTRVPGYYQPELVYSYSTTCEDYGCAIYEPYYYKAHIDRCDLEGVVSDSPFMIQNFSLWPYSRCTWIPDRTYRMPGLWDEQYYLTPEFGLCREYQSNQSGEAFHRTFVYCDPATESGCIRMIQGMTPIRQEGNISRVTIDPAGTRLDIQQYIDYLETCDPDKEPGCGGWVINGEPLKGMHQYRPFLGNATHLKDHPCDTFLVKADDDLIIPLTDEEIPYRYGCVGPCNQTEGVCELRFDISSGNREPVQPVISPKGNSNETPQISKSPVESLYCTILSIFGDRC